MSASNLGVCLAPSLFQLGNSGPGSSPYSRSSSSSPRRRRNTTRENGSNPNTLVPGSGGGMPDQRELDQSRAAHNCLTDMIQNYRKLFLVPEEAESYQRVSCMDQPWDPINMEDMGSQWQSITEQALQEMLKECHDKSLLNSGWNSVNLSVGGSGSPWDGVEVWHRKVGDGHPLKLWKTCVEVEAPPGDILHRLLNEKYHWDMNFMDGRVLVELDSQTDIYLFWHSSVMPHPLRQFCILRSWRQNRGYCILVEASVEHSEAPPLSNFHGSGQEDEVADEMQEESELVVGSIVLASRFLLEPCGAGRTKVTYISRTDLRGRSIEWYNHFYGHICASLMCRLRDSFKQGCVGPETKV